MKCKVCKKDKSTPSMQSHICIHCFERGVRKMEENTKKNREYIISVRNMLIENINRDEEGR